MADRYVFLGGQSHGRVLWLADDPDRWHMPRTPTLAEQEMFGPHVAMNDIYDRRTYTIAHPLYPGVTLVWTGYVCGPDGDNHAREHLARMAIRAWSDTIDFAMRETSPLPSTKKGEQQDDQTHRP